MPAWARPPFYGVFIVYALAAARAWVMLPVLAVGVLLGGPEAVLRVAWIVVAAGAAGFAGGLAYAVADPLLRRLGAPGVYFTWWLTVGVYGGTLMPLVSADDPRSRYYWDPQSGAAWFSISACAVLFGSVIASITLDTRAGGRRRRWVQRAQRVTSRVHPPAS